MSRTFLATLAFFLLPASVLAARSPASFSAAQSLLVASSSLGNAYAAGASTVLVAPVGGDFVAAGGSILTAAPVGGDELLFAGSIHSRAPVKGDVRVLGGSITIDEPIQGDLVAFGYSVYDAGHAGGDVFVAAANTTLAGGASGSVTIYGNNISLAGDFGSNVHIFAGGRVTLAASTTIRGVLSYQAPEPALIPDSATILGGVQYKNASYLPNVGTSRILALVSVGFFLFARILGALLLAGLLAGLFPRLAEMVVDRAYTGRPRHILLTTLLGFAIFVATPILFFILLLTFVGIGFAFLLLIIYALLVLLSFLYAGILLGGVLVRRYMRREAILWHDGILGMLALSIVALVPVVGFFAVFLLTAFSSGALLQIFFHFAFPREERTSELL